ncbi:MAG: Dna2/Cas4 domain-containing protein [Planctomycetes bacterium]|nr:Dna2/Cas4 domain-containing protein [Planctomycetota bacterium]
MESLSKILINYGYQELAKPKYPRVRHWPSDAGKCLRALVYQWRGEKIKSPNGRLFFIFADGNLHHELIVKQLEEAGVTVTMKEAPLRDTERNISGKLDALIKMDNNYYVLEIKSISRRGFDEVMRLGAKEEHVLQLQLYLYYVQNIFKINAKQGIILYKNKDTSHFADFPIDYDETYVQGFFNQLKVLETHVKEQSLPDRPYERDDWHCSYCDYRETCWAGIPARQIEEIKDEELVTLLGELLFAKEQRKDFEEKEELLNERVKQILKDRGFTEGNLGSYRVKFEEMVMRRLNQKKLAEQLGEDKLREFYEEKSYPKLTIKELEY